MNEIADILDKAVGEVKIDFIEDEKVIKTEVHKNLIVNKSHLIVRDLLFSADYQNTLEYLQIGDMNLEYTDDLTDLPKPTLADVTLINKVYQTSAISKKRYISNNRYALSLYFEVPKTAANNVDQSVYYSLVSEFGLFTRGMSMFSRLVKPIVKTRDIALNITWTIYL